MLSYQNYCNLLFYKNLRFLLLSNQLVTLSYNNSSFLQPALHNVGTRLHNNCHKRSARKLYFPMITAIILIIISIYNSNGFSISFIVIFHVSIISACQLRFLFSWQAIQKPTHLAFHNQNKIDNIAPLPLLHLKSTSYQL
mgnify:CR=1 FL=1